MTKYVYKRSPDWHWECVQRVVLTRALLGDAAGDVCGWKSSLEMVSLGLEPRGTEASSLLCSTVECLGLLVGEFGDGLENWVG